MKPKVLVVHNYYRQRSGEDEAVDAEMTLLRERGHVVAQFSRSSSVIESYGAVRNAALAFGAMWGRRTRRAFESLVRTSTPDIVHVHNTFPLIPHSVVLSSRRQGIPVVQTMHNFRLACCNALFFRNGQPCEDCNGRIIPWPGVMHGCYHDSRLQSAGMMIRLVNQRVAGAWLRGANLYIALTEFSRRKLADAGLPVERLVVKPNFFGMEAYGNDHERAYALFIGRISEEKGIGTLLDALVSMPDVPLKVVGDGALLPRYRSVVQARGIRHIEFLGGLDRRGTLGLLRNARCLIVPSLWYEGFPMVVVEAYAHGVPVVASRLGSLAEIVEHDRTGRHFEAGNAEDLAAQVRWFWQWPEKGSALAAQARVEYEKRYTPDRNYAELMSIYENAIASVGARINAQVQSSAPERAERSNA